MQHEDDAGGGTGEETGGVSGEDAWFVFDPDVEAEAGEYADVEELAGQYVDEPNTLANWV